VLREVDTQYLTERGYRFSTYTEGGLTLLVIHDYELPQGYNPETVELLIQIPDDYPDAALDMWWVFPHVTFAQNGNAPINADVRQAFAGFTSEPDRQWQRFSRHPQWRLGVDDLRSYLASLRSTMGQEALQLAA
jgi:hypothetical protein